MKPTTEQLMLRGMYAMLERVPDPDGVEGLREYFATRLEELDSERETDLAPPQVMGAVGLGRYEVNRWARFAMQRLVVLADETVGLRGGPDAGDALDEAVAVLHKLVALRALNGAERAAPFGDRMDDAAARVRAAVEVLVRTMIYARIALGM